MKEILICIQTVIAEEIDNDDQNKLISLQKITYVIVDIYIILTEEKFEMVIRTYRIL